MPGLVYFQVYRKFLEVSKSSCSLLCLYLYVCVHRRCSPHMDCVDFSEYAQGSPTFKPKRSYVISSVCSPEGCSNLGGAGKYKDTAFS